MLIKVTLLLLMAAVQEYGAALLSSCLDRFMSLQVCREALFMAAVKEYVAALLGPDFVHPSSVSMVDLYRDSSPSTPIVFVVAPGADATADLVRFAAAEHGRSVNRGLQVGQHLLYLLMHSMSSMSANRLHIR